MGNKERKKEKIIIKREEVKEILKKVSKNERMKERTNDRNESLFLGFSKEDLLIFCK